MQTLRGLLRKVIAATLPKGHVAMNAHLSLFVFLFLISVPSGDAAAQVCAMLSINVGDARSALMRAANESDLANAKLYAGQAKSALDDSAMSALHCKCIMAYTEFDTAGMRAGNARSADSVKQFAAFLNNAILSFNDAINAMQSCAPRR